MLSIDLNCDLGESFGVYRLGDDAAVLQAVTSANIACGFHAGDPAVMRETVRLCLEKGVSIGAHPGLPDLAGFGRRTMQITPREAYDMTVYQIGALNAFVQAEGGKMRHVKPHGALYNMAAVNKALSEAIAEAVFRIDPQLVLVGLAGSELTAAGERIGLRAAHEVFADRTYQPDGTLTPRKMPDALIRGAEQSVSQVIRMISAGKVTALGGKEIGIRADTVCLHGDGPDALAFALGIRRKLNAEGIAVRSL